MSYRGGQPMVDGCPNLEDRTARLMEQQRVDKELLNAMKQFASLHGNYAMNELKLWEAYGNISYAIEVNKRDIKALIKKQKKEK